MILLALLLINSVCGNIINKRKIGEIVCSAHDYKLVEAKFGAEQYLLCLRTKPLSISSLISRHVTLLVDLEEDQEGSQAFPLYNITMAYGFPMEEPSSGSAEGYIDHFNQFHGVLHLRNRTLHANPFRDTNLTKYFSFEKDNLVSRYSRIRRERAEVISPPETIKNPSFFPYQIEDHNRVPGVARARICDLLLLADKEFYEKDANSSLDEVVRRMIHDVILTDIIFRNSDFNEDGKPDNIGFSVKYILVLTSEETNTRVFGNLLSHPTVDGREYLFRFARLRRLSEVCLGVAFSGHAFHNKTLGLSFTSLGGGISKTAGGLCDRRAYGQSYNTLAIAHAILNEKERVPEPLSALTLAHEMGHSFGAQHDDYFPNHKCRGYLMGSQSSGYGLNWEFSICSKRLIAATLSSMSYCLITEDVPFCGNGIVEEGEACDCGLPSQCSQKDPCCTPRAGTTVISKQGVLHTEGCSVAPGTECHPSQGLCCLSSCKYADLSKSGINCKLQSQECDCTNDTAACRCGLEGRCLPDGNCHAFECALLGYKECQCMKSPGGKVGESNLCSVCCLVNRMVHEEKDAYKVDCVSAEEAVLQYLKNESALPNGWPGKGYYGPNVTLDMCVGEKCERAWVRAWRRGEACVTRGAVGVCSEQGLCQRVVDMPTHNIYPHFMRVKLRGSRRKSAANRISAYIVINLLIMLIK